MKIIILILSVMILISCSNETTFSLPIDILSNKDITPPEFLGYVMVSSNKIELHFNEKILISKNNFPSYKTKINSFNLELTFEKPLKAGERRNITGRVKDLSGNSTNFTITIWGKNEEIPPMYINEITTHSTTKYPPRTEIYILSDGNIGGLTLYSGIPSDYDFKFIFPEKKVKKGNFIVIWWMKKKCDVKYLNNEIDYSVETSYTPPTNNGIQTLAISPSPDSKIIDAIIYSSSNTISSKGFGNKINLRRVEKLKNLKAWEGKGKFCNSWAVDSLNSTGTRSISRIHGMNDSNTKKDWYITKTRGATFGTPNLSLPYNE